MSKWTNPEEWKRLLSGESCPICLNGRPTNIIAELEISYLTSAESGIKGACTLFFKRHAIELYDLLPEESVIYMRDIQRASKGIHRATRAVKMNYEIHGNTIPHLHTHLFPRYVGDQFEWQPINPRIVTESAYAPGEFDDFVAKVREKLK